MKLFNQFFILLIKIYQKAISPMLGANCRFHPTCSAYSLEAFQTLSLHRALYKSIVRILKCHPFHPGGHDPLHKE